MTFNEMWKQFHEYCKTATVTVNNQEVTFHCPVHNQTIVERVPYPFCRTPVKCAGNGYCKQEFACND
jgi:hypothetical protein